MSVWGEEGGGGDREGGKEEGKVVDAPCRLRLLMTPVCTGILYTPLMCVCVCVCVWS